MMVRNKLTVYCTCNLPQMRYASTNNLPSSRARDTWHPKWKLPMFTSVVWGTPTKQRKWVDHEGRISSETIIPDIHKCNKYLNYCATKMNRYWEEGEIRKFFNMMNILLTKSIAFKLLALRKSDPTWYWRYPLSKVLNSIDFHMKFISEKRGTGLSFKRVYIRKANGKWRPVGVPGFNTKLVHTSLDLMLRLALERYVPSWQHGFMPGRSIGTAGREFVQNIRKRPDGEAYEFDLNSCFNRVDVSALFNLPGLGGRKKADAWYDVATWLYAVLVGSPPKAHLFKKEDKEVGTWRKNVTQGGEQLVVTGLPQGSPISPFIAVLAMRWSRFARLEKLHNLTAYADDGIIWTDKKDLDIKQFFDKEPAILPYSWRYRQGADILERVSEREPTDRGFYLAPDKHYGKVRDIFKFLGVYYSLKGNKIAWHNLHPDGNQRRLDILKATQLEIDEFFNIPNVYSESRKEWKRSHWCWDINEWSTIAREWKPFKSQTIGQLVVWLLNLTGEYWPKLQGWINKKIMGDPFGASTFATQRILDRWKLLKMNKKFRQPRITQWIRCSPEDLRNPYKYIATWPEIIVEKKSYARAEGLAKQPGPGLEKDKIFDSALRTETRKQKWSRIKLSL